MNKVRIIHFVQYGVTNVHPIALVFMACISALTVAGRRSTVVLAVLAVCVFMPMQQRVVIGELDFNMLRLIMIVAWIRVLVRGEHRGLKMNSLDRVLIFWVVSTSFFYVMRVGAGGIVYRLGMSFDVLMAFFLFRMLLRTPGDVLILWRHLAWIVLVLTPFLVFEFASEYNVFGIFDYSGVEHVKVRNGRARAQGPLSHPILAGTFGAVTMPVFAAMFFGWKKERRLFAAACVAATITVLAAGSSGALMAWAAGVIGWGLWRFRRHTRPMLRVALLLAVVVHFARDKPIWHLIGRLSSLTGGTGFHRSKLIDAFVNRFSEWALYGTGNTANWGWGMQDTTNQYVAEGVKGGIVTLVLFIVVLRISFVQLRRARTLFERLEGPRSPWAKLAWGSSVSLAAHCVSFISVSYFGQMVPFFVIFLATIPALARVQRPKRAKSTAAPPPEKTGTPIRRTRSLA